MMLAPILILVLMLPSIVCYEPKPIGCFDDNFFSRDLEFLFTDSKLTLQKCLTECAEKNLKYFGLQAGKECYCGEEFGFYGRVSDELCNIPCTGNQSQICGGKWTNSIHLISYRMKTKVPNDSPWKSIAIISIIVFLLSCLASCFIYVKYSKIKKFVNQK